MCWFGGILAFLCAMPGYAQSKTATTTLLTVTSGGSPASSIAWGNAVTLTATVQAGVTPVTPGQVMFCDATAALCSDVHLLGLAQLTSSGTAVWRFRPPAGSHTYKAVFAGTNAYIASSSAAAPLTVNVGEGGIPRRP